MSESEVRELIARAFAGVTLDGGVSAAEAWVRDGDGSEKECRTARAQETTDTWEYILDQEALFSSFRSLFCFLDAKGFRFYLPACMMWILDNREDVKSEDSLEGLLFRLNPHVDDPEAHPSHNEVLKSSDKECFEILTEEQARAVARFVQEFTTHQDDIIAAEARAVLEKRWQKFL